MCCLIDIFVAMYLAILAENGNWLAVAWSYSQNHQTTLCDDTSTPANPSLLVVTSVIKDLTLQLSKLPSFLLRLRQNISLLLERQHHFNKFYNTNTNYVYLLYSLWASISVDSAQAIQVLWCKMYRIIQTLIYLYDHKWSIYVHIML